jgi:photosystem II stability/assembly factor-like uncharacterized protein
MKRLLICLLGIILFGQVRAQWTSAAPPYYRNQNSVCVVDQQNAVIVGGNEKNDVIRTIVSSHDHGATWGLDLDRLNQSWLRSVYFVNSLVGFSVGYDGAILRTLNGGSTWDTLTAPGNAALRHLNSVFFSNPNVGYIAGGFPANDSIQTIIKTIDGGNTWSIQRDARGYWLRAIFFVDSNTGFAVGDHATVLKTTNGGTNWNAITLNGNLSTRTLNSVYFLNSDTGFIVGGNKSNDSIQTIIKTTDGGSTWNIIRDNIGNMLNSIDFATGTKAYVAGNRGTLLTSDDAGNSWSPIILPNSINDTLYDVNCVNFLNADFGVAVGRNGKLLIYTSPTPSTPQASTLQASEIKNTSAQLNGVVNANSSSTQITFEYGITPSLGNSINAQPDTANGNATQNVQAQLNGLTPGIFYYFRIRAANSNGTNYGSIKQFYTANCEVPNCDFEIWDTTFFDKPVAWAMVGSVKKVSSYNGTFAVQMSGGTINDAGAVFLANPKDNGFSGGIPFAARPDTLVMHANYNIIAGDTGLVLMLFKRNGITINQMLLPITGNTGGNFSELRFPITFPTADIPDSLIIGVVSTNAFGAVKNPNSTITIDDLHFTGTNLTLPNADFQLWQTVISEQLQSWLTSGSDKGFPAFPDTAAIEAIIKVTDAASGHFAVRLHGDTSTNSNSPFISSGKTQNFGIPTFAVGGKHTTLNMFLKYLPQNNDSLFINMVLYAADSAIGYATAVIDTPMLNYTPVSIDIIYSNQSPIPDSGALSIRLGEQQIHGNSVAFIDNISFDGFRGYEAPSAILNIVKNLFCNIYPNPATNELNIQYWPNGTGEQMLEIFDCAGQKLIEQSGQALPNTLNTKSINISSLPAGYYILSITEGAGARRYKFAVNR